MTTYNPANENQIYCIGSKSATWFVNDNQLISFDQPDLINGTKFVKQNVSGQPYKITWDGGGIGKEHLIQNPANYSYSVAQLTTCKTYQLRIRYKLERCINRQYTWDANWTTYAPSFLQSIRKIENVGFWRNPDPNNNPCAAQGVNYFHYLYYDFYNSNCSIKSTYGFTGARTLIGNTSARNIQFEYDIIPNDGIYNYQIQITDGGNIYNYPITNPNSVNIIYLQGGIRYIFTAGSQSLSQQYQSDQNISLKCGIDCPPETCFKCRDGSQVCCYGPEGTVIDIVNDPDFEVEAC